MDSDKVVLDLINEMFRNKYKGTTFYCHNFGGYDIIFILKILVDYNSRAGDDPKFEFSFVFRKNSVLKVSIKRFNTITGRKDTINICDSYPILSLSLAQLCEEFNVSTIKGIFPYDFATETSLFYIGKTPSFFISIS